MNFYNDNDPRICAWLEELISAGLIPVGTIDERDIRNIQSKDLIGFEQCHFFAGISGWSEALRLAGWPSDRPVWTASCPCPPFSVAACSHGGAKGKDDSRDLWPIFFAIFRECHPPVLFGEQIASAISWGWWDRAAMDLEGEGYAVASAVLPANACGASHERKRLFFMADSRRERWTRHKPVKCFPGTEKTPHAINGDPLAGARCALGGDFGNLLLGNGISVNVERIRIKGYGNSIVPQVAAEFIKAFLETIEP